MNEQHWTERSIKYYLFCIVADFITQLENKMESSAISEEELAQKLEITREALRWRIDHPDAMTFRKMIESARALKMKVSIVAYEDDDPENKKGPINSEIFRMCWERLGKPRDFWNLKEGEN